MDRLFSAMAPTGALHIGNYLGAVRNWVDLQSRYDSFFAIADLHALTVPWEPSRLGPATIETARTCLAAGLDPEVATIFVQSHVPAHSELCWILSSLVTVPQLERMTQYKEKGPKGKEKASLALLAYPVLMASDILLYRARLVPVGEDQRQHLELVRLLAARFNSSFGEFFPIPEALVPEKGSRIMGLDDPRKKMSKTAHERNFIALTDSPGEVREKIRKAVTDPGKEIAQRPDKPAISNLLALYSLVAGKTIGEVEEMFRGKGYLDFKSSLSEAIIAFLEPLQEKRRSLTDERVRQALREGAKKAAAVAESTLAEVKERIGLTASHPA